MKKDIIMRNPVNNVPAPKIEKKASLVYLTQGEIDQLLSMPGYDLLGKRDVAILEVLIAAGLRVSELAALTINDIDLENRYILVYGMRTKERVVPVGERTILAVGCYLKCVRPILLSKCRAEIVNSLFLNNNGGTLTERSIRRILSKYLKGLGLKNNVRPRVLRDTCAVQLFKSGTDFRSVQQMLGYKNNSVHFLDVDVINRLNKVYKHAHPRS